MSGLVRRKGRRPRPEDPQATRSMTPKSFDCGGGGGGGRRTKYEHEEEAFFPRGSRNIPRSKSSSSVVILFLRVRDLMEREENL